MIKILVGLGLLIAPYYAVVAEEAVLYEGVVAYYDGYRLQVNDLTVMLSEQTPILYKGRESHRERLTLGDEVQVELDQLSLRARAVAVNITGDHN